MKVNEIITEATINIGNHYPLVAPEQPQGIHPEDAALARNLIALDDKSNKKNQIAQSKNLVYIQRNMHNPDTFIVVTRGNTSKRQLPPPFDSLEAAQEYARDKLQNHPLNGNPNYFTGVFYLNPRLKGLKWSKDPAILDAQRR